MWKFIYIRKWSTEIQDRARAKLFHLNRAKNLQDLYQFPGHRLEQLKGNRKDEYRIRVNVQGRICFKWENGNAFDVKLEDYH